MTAKPPTDRVRLRRSHLRGLYDRDSIDAILDAQPMCHVGYVKDGHPFVTPTFQWREGDRVYWHGSSASQMLRAATAMPVCLSVSTLDGYVMARSGFHHSVNYRSVTILGEAEMVTDEDEKVMRVDNFLNGLFPGRAETLRPHTKQEIKATTVLSLPISEASAKVRTGGPVDDEEDYALPIWAGVIPVSQVVGDLIPDERNLPGIEAPAHITDFRIG